MMAIMSEESEKVSFSSEEQAELYRRALATLAEGVTQAAGELANQAANVPEDKEQSQQQLDEVVRLSHGMLSIKGISSTEALVMMVRIAGVMVVQTATAAGEDPVALVRKWEYDALRLT